VKKIANIAGSSSYEDRRKAIIAFADALDAQKEEFAKLLTTEQGKPVTSANSSTFNSNTNESFSSFNSLQWRRIYLFNG